VPLLRQFRVYAAEQNQSMSRLAAAIGKLVDKNDEYDRAGQRLLKRLRNAPDRSTGGKITWTREQLYEEMFNERSKSLK